MGLDRHKWDSDRRGLAWGRWCSWVAMVLLAIISVSLSPNWRFLVEWWCFGGRGSPWVGSDRYKWDLDCRGLVGMDLGSDQHKWDSENGSVLVFFFFFGFVGMDLVVVDVDGGSGGGSGGRWFGFWIWNLDFVWLF